MPSYFISDPLHEAFSENYYNFGILFCRRKDKQHSKSDCQQKEQSNAVMNNAFCASNDSIEVLQNVNHDDGRIGAEIEGKAASVPDDPDGLYGNKESK